MGTTSLRYHSSHLPADIRYPGHSRNHKNHNDSYSCCGCRSDTHSSAHGCSAACKDHTGALADTVDMDAQAGTGAQAAEEALAAADQEPGEAGDPPAIP